MQRDREEHEKQQESDKQQKKKCLQNKASGMVKSASANVQNVLTRKVGGRELVKMQRRRRRKTNRSNEVSSPAIANQSCVETLVALRTISRDELGLSRLFSYCRITIRIQQNQASWQ